jgi:chromosomal replication initiator protein
MREIWEKVKAVIKDQVPVHSFKMWIEPIECQGNENETILLSCPNHFSRKRILDNYGMLIESQLSRIVGRPCPVCLKVADKTRSAGVMISSQSELEIIPQLTLPHIPLGQNTGRFLRKDFTFDRFVVGNCNQFAYSAALSLAVKNQVSQNALFLLSKTGLGKSHLSQAVGHHILDHYPSANVFYISVEDFTNEMVRAFRNNTIAEFKEKYRTRCDVLLLEDVHFLTGKERTQVELSHILDYLFNADKRIIFTSCYLPSEIPKINDQLRSRMTVSLISSIDSPDFQTRVKILHRKMKENGCQIPRDVLEYLASELSENVRQLESGLIGVTAKASLMGSPIDLGLAESVVKTITQNNQSITLDYIKQVVSEHFNVTISDLISKSRKKQIVWPRQMAMFLARKYTDKPLQVIGKSFNRYHATAIHSIAAVQKAAKTDMSIKQQLEYLCERIEGKEEKNGESGG